MLHRTVWYAPSASSKKVSFRLETGVGYVTSNCMGRVVRPSEKEISFKLGRICYIELYGTCRPPVPKGS